MFMGFVHMLSGGARDQKGSVRTLGSSSKKQRATLETLRDVRQSRLHCLPVLGKQ
jgi:hypothetical protein